MRAGHRRWWIRVAATIALTFAMVGTVAVPASANAPVRVKRGASCLPGRWKLDLERLVSEASVTQKLTATGAVDLQFRRGEFLQTYSDIITGETTGANGITVKVEQKYAGAVGGTYRTTGSAQLDLSDIDNATEMVMTTTVSGISGEPKRQAPAPGTQTAAVTLAFTCRGNTLQITAGGAVAQHYNRLR
jgi:hypothetical protein